MLTRWQAYKTFCKRIWIYRRSLRSRVVLYLISLFGIMTSAILVLLIISGLLNPLDHDLETFMNHELNNKQQELNRNFDNLAAHGIIMSQQLSEAIIWTMQQQGCSLQELNGRPELLQKIQLNTYDIVTDAMGKASCSGAFYMLNASVAHGDAAAATCNGLYLKYANLYSENTLNNEICMFRGDYSVARANNINLYSTWQLEFKPDTVPEISEMLSQKSPKPTKSFLMTKVTPLADSWEKVRLYLFPLLDENGKTMGVCGYEMSNLFFQLRSNNAVYRDVPLITAFLDKDEQGTYMGQLTDEAVLGGWRLTLEDSGKYTKFTGGNTAYIGKTLPVEVGQSKHLLAIMLPEQAYSQMLAASRSKAIAIFGMVMLLFIGAGYFLDRRYVQPIIGDLQQLLTDPYQKPSSDVQELNEIYSAWQFTDNRQKQKLMELELEKDLAQQEYEQTLTQLQNISLKQQELQSQYDKLQATLQEQSRRLATQLELLKQEKAEVQRQYESAQIQLQKAAPAKKEIIIDPDCYKMFVANLATLTGKEKEILQLYVAGNTPKEILVSLNIRENTLKYHNRNIYGKMGVKSYKELAEYFRYWQESQSK
ncbi:LuxR C-terminal-related transcriptional regulator [uncultured Phascolarctobacterium sp.]|uniref:LuxR C-terminal-related transcriptional regulator n=1 Tax=uncultured Phascolarctobacterium sp. TaxID=512296 RepID=UPI0026388674|nr:LuxR C-terminal-related transcriptional regulator [uncultured Phascolarctobacterium sp.]